MSGGEAPLANTVANSRIILPNLPNLLNDLVLRVARNAALFDPGSLHERVVLLDGIEHLLLGWGSADVSLFERATALQTRLEESNACLFETIRADIQRGDRDALRRWLLPLTEAASDAGHPESYDYRDAIVAGVLQVDDPGATSVERTDEMVFYQPTPTRQVLDLVDRLAMRQEDVFMDIGSGLGQVPMLVNICTGIRSIGVEIEPAYVAAARNAAGALALHDVTFIEADARDVSLELGTVFFMYTPFTGALLRTVLDRLHEQAERREIRVCAFGPFVPSVAAERWLAPTEPVREGRVTILRSNVMGV